MFGLTPGKIFMATSGKTSEVVCVRAEYREFRFQSNHDLCILMFYVMQRFHDARHYNLVINIFN